MASLVATPGPSVLRAPPRLVKRQARSQARKAEPGSLTAFLEGLLRYRDNAHISVRDLLGGLETRAFGIPLAVLAACEVVPVPIPGFSLVISVPMAMVGAQMIVDRDRLWLPRSLLNRRVPASALKRVARAMLPTVRRIDGLTRQRGVVLTGTAGRRVAGLAVLLLALLIALPVPGTNAPLALTVLVLALGLVRNDGLLIAAGLLLTVVAAALMGVASVALVNMVFGTGL
ncbi:exopolysaccharide biosynthesis protein [Hyphomicrobium sp. 2TAF46]|uniref:exopolysaccharide biosynthesis protein n=1 Tax=Hyphomicrobium sp. 2TAF46 TaxID=3233019 RepID=UPI003F934263